MSIGDRILSRFNERMAEYTAETRCGRVDLQLTDFEPMSPNEAVIMLQYNRQAGVPKRTQIAEWVLATFPGQLRIDGESILHYPDLTAVTATVRTATLSMPMDKSFVSRLLRTGSAEYMDSDNAIWEVREGETGGKYLMRVSQDDVSAILSEKLDRIKSGSLHHAPKLAHIVTAGISDPAVGDRVEFLDIKDNTTVKFGQISAVRGDNLTVTVKGEAVTIPRNNLIAVTKESPQSERERRQMEEDFYAEYYFSGDRGLAKKLVK